MATYQSYLDGTIGYAPTGWTERFNTGYAAPVLEADTSAIRGRRLNIDLSTAGRYLLSLDSAPGTQDADMLILAKGVYASTPPTSENGPAIWLRGSGAAGSETGIRVDCHYNSFYKFAIWRYSSGTGTSMYYSTESDFTWSRNTWFYIRTNVTTSSTTTTVKLRAWNYGDTEPSTWMTSNASTSYPRQTGWMGVFGITATMANHYAYLGIGTLGDSAPLPKKLLGLEMGCPF